MRAHEGANVGEQLEEEQDLLRRSKRRNKGPLPEREESADGGGVSMEGVETSTEADKEATKGPKGSAGGRSSYMEAAMGFGGKAYAKGFVEEDDGAVSDDDVIEESTDPSWFGIGMTREEKLRARRPWWNSLIVKLVGRPIGYHYLLRRIQIMWRTSAEPMLIDLGNYFYIVKLFGREEYERALTEGP